MRTMTDRKDGVAMSMLTLFMLLLERTALMLLFAYILMNFTFLKATLSQRDQKRSIVILTLVFLIFGIFSNLSGVVVQIPHLTLSSFSLKLPDDAVIANSRVLSISVAGLIGGPWVGGIVGIATGIFRFLQGGLSPLTYLISSSLTGIASGLIGRHFIHKSELPQPAIGGLTGLVLEGVQIICIYLLAWNSQEALALIQLIALPMALINSLGLYLFLAIIRQSLRHEDSLKAVQTEDVLNLTQQTFSLFHDGLNQETAQKAAQLIYQTMKIAAVSITDQKEILAFIGAGSDHHLVGMPLQTNLSYTSIDTGQTHLALTPDDIGCHHPGCPLKAGIIVPLKTEDTVAGTLKFYFDDEKQLTQEKENWATGLGAIFSTQLQLGIAQRQKALLKEAELRSLQGQVNPHFFFNAMNTIRAVIRTDPDQARQLLSKLSNYFRSNIKGHRETQIPLTEELQYVQNYLEIEQTRFPDRFQVDFQMDPGLEMVRVPPFIIQVLVENAIKHAFGSRPKDNQILVEILDQVQLIQIKVQDNGFGISESIISRLGKEAISESQGSGTAIENLNKRLMGLYDPQHSVAIQTSPQGTSFTIRIPKEKGKIAHDESNPDPTRR